MDSLAQLKEPITKTYTHFEVFYALIGRADNTTDPNKRKLDYGIWLYFEQDGKKEYARQLTYGTIADLSVPVTDNQALEELRVKAVQADDLLKQGVIGVHGFPGT